MTRITITMVCLAIIATLTAAQSTIHVDAGAAGPGSGTLADPFVTIQDGVDAAVDGDTVAIAAGFYAENVVVPPVRVDIIGAQGVGATVVDGNNQATKGDMPVFTFAHPQNHGSNVRHLTIQGGRGTMINEVPEVWVGGGILCIDVTIGIRFCIFDSNEVVPYHGNDPSVEGWGGGVGWVGKGPEVISCTFVRNFAMTGGGAVGGTFATSNADYAEFYSCMMIENHTLGVGGGVGLRNANAVVVNCTLSKNLALLGGGIHVTGSGRMQDFQNTIVRDNLPDEVFLGPGAVPGFFDCNVKGGVPGGNTVGLIDTDPIWVDPSNNDFHLGFGSPMIDSANDTGGIPITDFEGDPRILGAGIDMGADEFTGLPLPAQALSGNVGIGQGGPYEVLTVNGTTGDYARRVAVAPGGKITFAVDQPPTNKRPAEFLIAGMLGTPKAVCAMPFAMGDMVVEPAFMNPSSPASFTLVNGFTPGMPGLLPARPTPWAARTVAPFMTGYVTFQGIVLEDSFTPRVTNAIVIEIL